MSVSPLYQQPAFQALYRVRRMGWVLAGTSKLADHILLDAVLHPSQQPFDGDWPDPFENLFTWAFRTLDDACSDIGVMRSLPDRSLAPNSLSDRLQRLPYELRVATLLIVIEEFSLDRAAQLSGRSPFALASAAETAVQILSPIP